MARRTFSEELVREFNTYKIRNSHVTQFAMSDIEDAFYAGCRASHKVRKRRERYDRKKAKEALAGGKG